MSNTVIKDTSGSNNTLARAPCRCSGHRDSNTLLERTDCLIGKDVHGYSWISMPLYPSLSTCKGPHLQSCGYPWISNPIHLQSNPTTPLVADYILQRRYVHLKRKFVRNHSGVDAHNAKLRRGMNCTMLRFPLHTKAFSRFVNISGF